MYRVLAARSLKFLEQRQEDTASYQRKYKAAAGRDGLRGIRSAAAAAAAAEEEAKENLSAVEKFGHAYGEGEDYHARLKETSQGGPFHPTYPERITNTSGSYARQSGERVAQSAPMLGYPPKPSTKEQPAIGAAHDSTQGNGERKPHATVIVHEKRDKSDQLNLRIATSVERQKLRTYILVDDVVQRRLHKKVRKDLSTSTSLAKLRGVPPPTPHATLSGVGGGGDGSAAGVSTGPTKDLVGVGVWSQLGSAFNEQGAADLDLPILNYGVPLRELTKSKQPRPAPLKESSEHRKKYDGVRSGGEAIQRYVQHRNPTASYESLVELFRTQRHKVIKPHPRDGQDGVPRPQSGKASIGGAQSLAAAMNANSTAAWDVNPLLSDVSIADESGQNPANQSLIARLYQTQNQRLQDEVLQAAANQPASSVSLPSGVYPSDPSSSDGASGSGSPMKRSASSASGFTSKSGRPSEAPQTSVDRIAAFQPRKVGWDATSVRPLATSASTPNFDRRPGGVVGVGHSQKMFSANLLALPDAHPAQSHPSVLPSTHIPQQANAKLEAQERERQEKEDRRQSNMAASLGKSASTSGGLSLPARPSSSQAIALANAAAASETGVKHRPPPSRVKFASGPTQAGLISGDGVKLHPDHPDYIRRKQELFTLAEQRRAKRKLKSLEAQQLAESVQRQLDESRLDHLHRWRNAFDGTKQKLDRILIQRLCQRAEIRARNLEGGGEFMEPLVDHVLADQEATEHIGDPAWAARTTQSAQETHNRKAWRAKRDDQEFVQAYSAVYDEHAALRIDEGDEESAGLESMRRAGESADERAHSKHDLHARQQDAERRYHASVVADASTLPQHFHRSLAHARKGSGAYTMKAKNTSGHQQTHTGQVELTEGAEPTS